MDNQTLDADQLRTILERTLVAAEQRGMVNPIDEGWLYQEGTLAIHYDPTTDELRFTNGQTEQNFCWSGEQLVDSAALTAQQAIEFHDLKRWLDDQAEPSVVDLRAQDIHSPTLKEVAALRQSAEQLFEYYATQGEPAFKLSANSPIDYYSIELNGIDYFLSRDETTGTYNLQRDNTDLSLNWTQTVTRQDLTAWSSVSNWLDAQSAAQPIPSLPQSVEPDFATPTYWEQHQAQLEQILPIAERFISFQESIGETWIGAEERYSTSVGQYDIGYDLEANQIQVQRNGVDLRQVGSITEVDFAYFEALRQWLDERDNSAQQITPPPSTQQIDHPWQSQPSKDIEPDL